MSHEVETLAYAHKDDKDIPWHGLGKKVSRDKQTSTEEWIKEAGLNWVTALAPLTVMSKEGMIETGISEDVATKFDSLHGKIVNRFATIRMSDNSILGTVGPQYSVLQNEDAFKWFQPFIDNGEAVIESAGSLWNGQKVWVLAKINREEGMVNGDKLNKYLLLSNSHDGTMAVRVGTTMVRPICWNTMQAAIQDKASKLIRIRHSSKLAENLTNIRSSIDAVNDEMNATIEIYKKLQNSHINQKDLTKFVKMVLDVDVDKPEKDLPTRTVNTLDKIFGYYKNSPGCEGKSLYDAYNSITYYLSHDYGRNIENRFDSINFGTAFNTSQRALKIAIGMSA